MTGKWKPRLMVFWRETVKPFLVIVIVLCSLRSAVADWNPVPTGSMKPSILEGDRIFVNKLAYDLKVPFTRWRIAQWGNPQRGDVVILFSPDEDVRMVKRVIGLPGDIIEMHNNRLIVNGVPAVYGPPDAEVVRTMQAVEAPLYRLATETIDHQSHPVMTLPTHSARRSFRSIAVPAGKYFVMGDNRDNSRDSRWFGFIERDRIVGRVSAVILSLDYENYYLPRWDRFFHHMP